MRIAIVDLKCTDDFPHYGLEEHEIIFINALACELSSEAFLTLEELRTYVKPTVRPSLTKSCTARTGVEQEVINLAKTLTETLPDLGVWMKKSGINAWASWGNCKSQFIIECRVKALDNVFKDIQYFDLQKIFSQVFGWRVELNRALMLRSIFSESCEPNDVNKINHLFAKEEIFRNEILKQARKIIVEV